MLVDLGGVALRQTLAHVGAEVLGGPAAGVLGRVGEVGVQEGLSQSLASPVRQRGDGVGAHPKKRCDVGGLLTLDLEVPQHHLPPLGKGGEGTGGCTGLESLDRGVLERNPGVEGGQVVGRGQPGGGADPVDVQTPDRGEQVRAEGDVGAAAALEDPHDLGERVRNQVVGVGPGDKLPGEPARGVDVALEQDPVGLQVSAADARDQLRIAGCVQRPDRLRHGELGHRLQILTVAGGSQLDPVPLLGHSRG